MVESPPTSDRPVSFLRAAPSTGRSAGASALAFRGIPRARAGRADQLRTAPGYAGAGRPGGTDLPGRVVSGERARVAQPHRHRPPARRAGDVGSPLHSSRHRRPAWGAARRDGSGGVRPHWRGPEGGAAGGGPGERPYALAGGLRRAGCRRRPGRVARVTDRGPFRLRAAHGLPPLRSYPCPPCVRPGNPGPRPGLTGPQPAESAASCAMSRTILFGAVVTRKPGRPSPRRASTPTPKRVSPSK